MFLTRVSPSTVPHAPNRVCTNLMHAYAEDFTAPSMSYYAHAARVSRIHLQILGVTIIDKLSDLYVATVNNSVLHVLPRCIMKKDARGGAATFSTRLTVANVCSIAWHSLR